MSGVTAGSGGPDISTDTARPTNEDTARPHHINN